MQDTITALQHGHSGVTTYPLSHPLEGWHAAITSGGHQVVHRTDPDTKALHVGYAGHNVADAEERLGGSGGGESSALPVEFHKSAEKDFDGLHPQVQDRVLDTIDRLSRREPHPHDHALTGPLKGWGAARADFLNRVTHRYEDNEGNAVGPGKASRLFIGHVGPHNYDDAIKRLTSLTDYFSRALQPAPADGDLIQRQSAAVSHDDGVMVAFVPPPEVAAQLALHGGQMADDLHITMAYLGNVSDYTPEQLALLPQLVSAWAMRQKPVTIRIAGVGTFNNTYKDQHVLWAHPDIPGGVRMHVSLADNLEQYGFRLPSEHGWTPHMTLQFVDKHKRFMPQVPDVSWEATEVVTFVGAARHAARLGLRPSTPTTL